MRSRIDRLVPSVVARWRRHAHHRVLHVLARYGHEMPARCAGSLESWVLTLDHLERIGEILRTPGRSKGCVAT